MALRVTQGIMYSSFTTQMNTNLSRLMDSNMQASSQKRINRPSDDAIGAGRVIAYRASLERLNLYENNMESALGWLSTTDGVLSGEGSVLDVLTRAKSLAQQASTGTYDKDNREQISYELRHLMDQLITLSNTTYEGRHIFSGHKTDKAAYRAGLGVTCNDDAFAGSDFHAQGGTNKTIIIQPTTSGTSDAVDYEYSDDGGKTWKAATKDLAPGAPYTGKFRLDAGGTSVFIDNGKAVESVDRANPNEKDNGTWFYVRPTAIYQGDDAITQVVTPFGNTAAATAEGAFPRDVSVRIEKMDTDSITFSYSVDDGSNWIQGVAPNQGASSKIPVAGGYLSLTATPAVGDQFIIHPRRADIDFMISDTDTITVNQIGKDIFGGLYLDPDPTVSAGFATAVEGVNLFETMGRLVAYTETNSQQGAQRCLAELEDVLKRITSQAAVVGARENRLTFTHDALLMRKYDEEDGLSKVEDVDAMELMVRQAQQNTAYSSVLKSSSMIMQMSLLNYL